MSAVTDSTHQAWQNRKDRLVATLLDAEAAFYSKPQYSWAAVAQRQKGCRNVRVQPQPIDDANEAEARFNAGMRLMAGESHLLLDDLVEALSGPLAPLKPAIPALEQTTV